MPPAVLVDLGLEAVRQPRRGAFVRHVADLAGHAGTAAIAAVRTFPGTSRVVFADPSGVRTEDAFHLEAFAFAFPLIETPSRMAIFRTALGVFPIFFAMASNPIVFASSISCRSSENERPGRLGAIMRIAPHRLG